MPSVAREISLGRLFTPNGNQLERVCFTLQVRPEKLDAYRARHRSVWREMLQALRETGWTNYSLFLRPDGLLVGYFETPSLERALAGMAAREANTRWQADMAEFFAPGGEHADRAMLRIEEVFHLD